VNPRKASMLVRTSGPWNTGTQPHPGFRTVVHEPTRPHCFAGPIRRGSRAKYGLQGEGRFPLSCPRCAGTRPLARCAGTGADKPPLRPRVRAVRQRPAQPPLRPQPGCSRRGGRGREPTLNCPLYQHYKSLLHNKTKDDLAKLTIARQIAAVALAIWKKEEAYAPAKLRKTS
jgi:hypothetical protein